MNPDPTELRTHTRAGAETLPRSAWGRILLAEDDNTSRLLIQRILQASGYVVEAVPDGETAWSVLQNPDPPRLALLDWTMPDLDGVALCRRIKQWQPDQTFTYVVMLTARTENIEVVHALQAGADDYVSKPPNADILCARIQAGMRIIDMQDRLRAYAHEMETLAAERAAQLAHADRLSTIGALSAGVAHEINNPTSFLSINLQTIERSWPVISGHLAAQPALASDPRSALLLQEMPSILVEMRKGIVRIRDIVDGLRTYGRSDHGKKERVAVNARIEDAVKLCRNRLGQSTMIELDLAADLPGVHADVGQLEQVFVNLLMNAADAIETAPPGIVRIRSWKDGETVLVSVRDSGPGIPPEHLEKLFKPFFTTKPLGKGTGLGLSICQSLVESHGGWIRARNHEAGGAEFTVVLPALPGKQAE